MIFTEKDLAILRSGEACSITLSEDILSRLSGVTSVEIKENLRKFEVTHGYNELEIDQLLSGRYGVGDKVVLAERVKPKKGKTGYFNYLITDINKKVSKSEDGKADFYEVGLIRNIEKGEKIVEIVPPTEGQEGYDIFGVSVQGILGDSANPKKIMGKGVVLTPDNRYLIAKINGVYKRNPIGVVFVDDQLEIKGDQDFGVGNIETTSSIYIKGDIKPGFKCSSNSAIKVDGAIEDAYVKSGDSIISKKGLLAGNEPVVAKESIRTKYIVDRKNITCKDLVVEGMISNSEIECMGELKAKKLSGGVAKVKDRVEVDDLGNESFDPTIVEVGLNQKVLARLDRCKADEVQLKSRVEEINKMISDSTIEVKKLDRRLKSLMENNTSKDAIIKVAEELKLLQVSMNKNSVELQNNERRIDSLKKEYDLLSKKVEATNPEIIVNGTMYTGVSIRLKLSGRLEIKENHRRARIFFDRGSGEVKIEKL